MENKAENLSKKFSKCVNYLNAVVFPGFEERGNFYEMSSISEIKAGKLIKEVPKPRDCIRTYNGTIHIWIYVELTWHKWLE